LIASGDVIWRLVDQQDELIIDFEITYFYKEIEGITKV
jgi:hypothetical protein